MHIKLDENTPIQLLKILKDYNIQASDVYTQGLSGTNDRQLARHCREHNYILITLDMDFSEPLSYPPQEHAGIIILRPARQGIQSVTACFRNFLQRYTLDNAKNKTIIVEENYIRVRE